MRRRPRGEHCEEWNAEGEVTSSEAENSRASNEVRFPFLGVDIQASRAPSKVRYHCV
jgi:hypothetical protein